MKLCAILGMMLLILPLIGCATYASLEHGEAGSPLVFGGTRIDLDRVVNQSENNAWLDKQAIYNPVLDMPFSMVSDTLLVPYTVFLAAARKFR